MRSGGMVPAAWGDRSGGGLVGEQVARLAFQFPTDRFEGGEADRLGLAGLEDRQVGEGQSHPLGQFGQGHAARVEQVVKCDHDVGSFFGGHHTVPSRSSRIAAPWRNTRARMNRISGSSRLPPRSKSDCTSAWASRAMLASHMIIAATGIAPTYPARLNQAMRLRRTALIGANGSPSPTLSISLSSRRRNHTARPIRAATPSRTM